MPVAGSRGLRPDGGVLSPQSISPQQWTGDVLVWSKRLLQLVLHEASEGENSTIFLPRLQLSLPSPRLLADERDDSRRQQQLDLDLTSPYAAMLRAHNPAPSLQPTQ